MPVDHCITAWTETISSLFEIKIRDPDIFTASAEAYLLGDVVFTITDFKAQTFNRSVRHTRLGATDHLVLELYLTGSGSGCLGDDFIAMSPYQVNLLDYRKTLFTTVEDASVISFVIPRELLPSTYIECFPAQAWHTEAPKGRLLASMMKELWRVIPESDQKDAEPLLYALVGLLNGVLTPKQQRTAYEQRCVQTSTLAAMKAFIRANLHRSDLNTQDLCQAFNCSRATVYRCFKEESGVEAYIRNQRLKYAFHQLSTAKPDKSKTPIYRIALASGFTHPAYFSRLFKQTFGATPSEIYYDKLNGDPSQALIELDTSHYECIDTFKDWVTRV